MRKVQYRSTRLASLSSLLLLSNYCLFLRANKHVCMELFEMFEEIRLEQKQSIIVLY